MYYNRVLELKMGDLIPSPTTYYQVQNYLGCGTYGIVFQCRNVSTNEMVALKIIKSTAHIHCAEKEEFILQNMKELHSEMYNIVGLKDSFTYKDNYYLVFELLGIDLKKFMQISPGQHLELKQIRPILHQLATSLEFLKSARIVHTDLKPQNIMMVDHVRQPLKVKVIDFGLACNNPKKKNQIGHVRQSLWYRSPEIVQKAPFNEAIDVWSLGCIAAELFMGRVLFPASDETNLMTQIQFTTGKPVNERNVNPYWFWPKQWLETRFLTMPRLTWGEDDHAEICDLENFINLLTEMLTINRFERITPRQILQHPFMTMSHFEGPLKNSSYVKLSKDLMDICRDQTSDDLGHGDHIILQKSLHKDSSSSTCSLAKESNPAGMGHEEHSFLHPRDLHHLSGEKNKYNCNSPDDSRPETRRSERLAAIRKRQKWVYRPSKVVRGNDKSEPAPSNSRQVPYLKKTKRKRDEEEVPVLEETCPGKRRRAARRKKTAVETLLLTN